MKLELESKGERITLCELDDPQMMVEQLEAAYKFTLEVGHLHGEDMTIHLDGRYVAPDSVNCVEGLGEFLRGA